MFVDSCTYTVKGRTYSRHLLRESFRENGKVCHRTLANVSHASQEEIQAMKLALKHKHNLQELGNVNEDIRVQQGLSVGAVITLWQLAKRLGVVQALGNSQDGKRALWQVLARVIDQGSRLSAVRLANSHAACDVLSLDAFDEDDLYANLDWLAENQDRIEDRLQRPLASGVGVSHQQDASLGSSPVLRPLGVEDSRSPVCGDAGVSVSAGTCEVLART